MTKIFDTDVVFLEDVIFKGNIECKKDATFRSDLTVYGTFTAVEEVWIPVEGFKRPNTFWNRLDFLVKGE